MKKRKLLISILAGFLAALLLLGLLAGLMPSPANAASSSEIKEQIEALEAQGDQIQSKIDELNQQFSENMSEMERIVAQKNVIDQQVALLHQQQVNLNEQIAAYGVLIADKQAELDEAQNRLAELNEKNKERIRAMEEDGDLSYWSVLFEANSFMDLLDRVNMIEEIAASDRRRLNEMRVAARQVEQAQAALTEEKQALLAKKEELAVMEADMEAQRAEADALLTQLNALGEEYENYILEREAEMTALSQQIAQKNNEYDEAKHKEWEESSIAQSIKDSIAAEQTTAPTSKPDPEPEENDGPPDHVVEGLTWVVPVKYIRVTSPYGMRMHPIHHVWMMHTGIDLAAPKGRPVWATRAGVVVTAAWSDAYGNYVVIDHGDGFQSLYAHMTHYEVYEGQFVNAGEKIGEVGSTGNSTGPHLHFEIHYNGSTVNPAEYVNLP